MEISKRHEQPSRGTFLAAITVCTAAACLGWRPATATDAVPLAAFGHLPPLEDVAISPDGTKIAFVRTNGASRKLIVAPLGKTEVIGADLVCENKLRDVDWIDDDYHLDTLAFTTPS